MKNNIETGGGIEDREILGSELDQELGLEDVQTKFEGLAPVFIDPATELDVEGKSFAGQIRSKFYEHLRQKYANHFYFPGLDYEEFIAGLDRRGAERYFRPATTYELIGSEADGRARAFSFDLEGALFVVDISSESPLSSDSRIVAFEKSATS